MAGAVDLGGAKLGAVVAGGLPLPDNTRPPSAPLLTPDAPVDVSGLDGSPVAAALATSPRTLSPEARGFQSLGPARTPFDPGPFLDLPGLAPRTDYEITLIRRHPYAPADLVSLHHVRLRTNQSGQADVGGSELARALGRLPSASERHHGDYFASKLTVDTPRNEVSPAQRDALRLLDDHPSDSLFVYATPLENRTSLPTERFYQNFEQPPAVIDELDPKRDGLVGAIYRPPAGVSTKSAVLLIGGSGGHYSDAWARYLSSQGHVVLGMDYFTYDPGDPNISAPGSPTPGALSHLIDRVPLERFLVGFERLKKEVSSNTPLVFMGESRGGEAALAFAQHLGDKVGLANVVALRPLHFSVGSKINGAAFREEPEHASWTVNNRPLPFAPLGVGREQLPEVIRHAREAGGLEYSTVDGVRVPRATLLPVFKNLTPSDDAFFDVPNRRSLPRLTVISGEADGLWPAKEAALHLEQKRGCPDDIVFVSRGAGHYTFPGRTSAQSDDLFLTGDPKDPRRDQAVMVIDGGTRDEAGWRAFALYDILNEQAVSAALPGGEGIVLEGLFPEYWKRVGRD